MMRLVVVILPQHLLVRVNYGIVSLGGRTPTHAPRATAVHAESERDTYVRVQLINEDSSSSGKRQQAVESQSPC